MRKILTIALVFAGAFLFAPAARAQFTTVTGTVIDPHGIPYANGTMSATLVPATPGGWRLSGQPYAGQIPNTALDANGTFTATFGDNALILPAGSQWQFTVRSNQGGVPLPLGTGSQAFTVTITITGTSQDVSATLSAAAPALARFTSGTGTVTSVACGNLVNIFTCSVTNPTTTPTLTFAPLSAGPSLDCSTFAGADMGAQLNACIAALPATGGFADATKFTSPQNISTGVTVNKSAIVLTCDIAINQTAAVTITANNAAFEGCPDKSTQITKGANIDQFAIQGAFDAIKNLTLIGNHTGAFAGTGVTVTSGSSFATIADNAMSDEGSADVQISTGSATVTGNVFTPISGQLAVIGLTNSDIINNIFIGTAPYTSNGFISGNTLNGGTQPFATLPAAENGSTIYCNDCTVASPTAGGGTGAYLARVNGAWDATGGNGGGACPAGTANQIQYTDGTNCQGIPGSSGNGAGFGDMSLSPNVVSTNGVGLTVSAQLTGTGTGNQLIGENINTNNETADNMSQVIGMRIFASALDGGGSADEVDAISIPVPTGGTVNYAIRSQGIIRTDAGSTLGTNIFHTNILMQDSASPTAFTQMDMTQGFSQTDGTGNQLVNINYNCDSGKPCSSLNSSGVGDTVTTSHGFNASSATALNAMLADYAFGAKYTDANDFQHWFGPALATTVIGANTGFGVTDNVMTPTYIVGGGINAAATLAFNGLIDVANSRLCGPSIVAASPAVMQCPIVEPDKIDYRVLCNNQASPAVCAAAPAGAVAVPTGTNPTLTINTTALTAASIIQVTVDASLTISATTCNTTLSNLVAPVIISRVPGTSFTIQIPATVATHPVCVAYNLFN